MSYINPQILAIPNPKGIDVAIADIQLKLSAVTYLEKIFGRAFIMKEMVNGKECTVPKVYNGKKEYYTALPNDSLSAYVFFVATGPDEYDEFERNQSNIIERKVSLIFWCNLKKINPSKDYIFTEEIKADLMKQLSFSSSVKSVDSIIDEEFAEIFSEVKLYDKYYEGKNQPITYPFAGLRINMTLSYRDSFDCNAPLANQ